MLNKEHLSNILYYDETSPSFLRWKVYKGPRAKKDSIAGSQRKDQYWVIRIDKKLYLVHRVIWELLFGDLSEDLVINHIDNNPSNNNISNLELCTHSHNSSNAKMHTGKGLREDNISGVNGICEIDNGAGSKYARVAWVVDKKLHRKYFSYNKLGKDIAWQEAISFKNSL